MPTKILHIVFSDSGATALRKALRSEGRDDRVISLLDDLSFGPINPPDADMRKTWVEQEFGFAGWPDTPEGPWPWAETEFGDVSWEELGSTARKFWDEAQSSQYRKIAWLSRRSAKEYAGFLEWLWRMGDAPCEVIDVTDTMTAQRYRTKPPGPPIPAAGLAKLLPDEIQEKKLFDRAEVLPPAAQAHYRDQWRQLREENAPLRVTDGDVLISAPITFFDQLLLSQAQSDWRKVAMVIIQAWEAHNDEHLFQVRDMVLAARINALVGSGKLEFQGMTAFDMRASEVRLPRLRGSSKRRPKVTAKSD
jgi:Protein of unknown function/Domain of unknown function (DUF1835)